jgi:glycosyltransferase involved in cell wall biosynthesis
MKIIYFSLGYSTHDHRFLTAMSDAGHDVFYLQLARMTRQVEDRPIPSRVTVVKWAGGQTDFRWRDLPKLVIDFRRVVREIKPDLIHAGPIQTCAFIAVLSGFRPILTMSWGFDLMDDVHRNKWWEWVTRYTLKRSTFFTSDATITRDKAISYAMNPDRTVVFPWGVDLDRFNVSTFQRSNVFTLFCSRSWESRYGVDVLARAFVKIAQQREDVHLMLLGGGSLGSSLRNILINGGAADRVTFPGHIANKELPRFYHMADLYISPSHVDGSSVSLMEALACGVPCLVSDIPANKEWIKDGGNGWLFKDNDANDLAAKILKIIDQPEMLKTISIAARTTAEQKANWTRNAQVLNETYQRVISLR